MLSSIVALLIRTQLLSRPLDRLVDFVSENETIRRDAEWQDQRTTWQESSRPGLLPTRSPMR